MANFSITTSGGILDKAGAEVSSDVSQAMLLRFSDAGEALVFAVLRKTDLSSVSAEIKPLATETAETYAAMLAIQYDPSGFFSGDAELKLDLLRDNLIRNIDLIKDDDWKTFSGLT